MPALAARTIDVSGVPKAEEISKAGAVSISVPEKQGAINVGKGGRPRRASMPGDRGGFRGGMGGDRGPRPQPPAQPPAPPPAAPAAPAGA